MIKGCFTKLIIFITTKTVNVYILKMSKLNSRINISQLKVTKLDHKHIPMRVKNYDSNPFLLTIIRKG